MGEHLCIVIWQSVSGVFSVVARNRPIDASGIEEVLPCAIFTTCHCTGIEEIERNLDLIQCHPQWGDQVGGYRLFTAFATVDSLFKRLFRRF
jgi:hypothetical protein